MLHRRSVLSAVAIAAAAVTGCAATNPRVVVSQQLHQLPANSEWIERELQLATRWIAAGRTDVGHGHLAHAHALFDGIDKPQPEPPASSPTAAAEVLQQLRSAESLAAVTYYHAAPDQLLAASMAVYAQILSERTPPVHVAAITATPAPLAGAAAMAAVMAHLDGFTTAAELLAGTGKSESDRDYGLAQMAALGQLKRATVAQLHAAGAPEPGAGLAQPVPKRPRTKAQLQEACGLIAQSLTQVFGAWLFTGGPNSGALAQQLYAWQLRAIRWGQPLPAWPGWTTSD